MAKCPHCSEAIDSLSGFMPTADVEERLKTQKTALKLEITALTTEVVELRPKASGYDAVVAERDGLQGKIDSRTQKDARTSLFTDRKVDPGLIDSFETMYASSQVGATDEEKKPFEDWFATEAEKHVLLAPHFNGAAPATTTTTPPDTTQGTGTNTLPATPPGTAPPPPPHNGKFTNVDIQAVFNSPAYQALPLKEKQAKLRRMEAGDMS